MLPTTRLPRLSGLLVAGAVTVVTLSACSGAASAPDDASTDDFCGAFFENRPQDADASAEALQAWVDQMSEVGTFEGMSDEAREGFEIFVSFVDDLSEDDLADLQAGEFGEEMSSADEQKAEAFFAEASEECFREGGAMVPDDLPETE